MYNKDRSQMPEKIIIGESIFQIHHNSEKISKTSLSKGALETIIFDGGIGEFLDLIYRNKILIARTTEGWFFSRDLGINWIGEDEYKIHNPSFFEEPENNNKYNWMTSLLKNYISQHTNLVSSSIPSVEEWILENDNFPVELLEVKNENELELFINEILRSMSINKLDKLLFIYPENRIDLISKSIFNLHARSEIIRSKKLLKRVINQSLLMSDTGIENLYFFERNMERFKMQFDINTIIISDLYVFFREDKSPDFVESTIRLIREISYKLKCRIIVVLNLEMLNEISGSNLRKVVRHPFIDCHQLVIEYNPNGEINKQQIKDVI